MIETLTRHLSGAFHAWKYRMALDALLRPVFDRYSSQPLATAGLVVKTATTGVLVKTGATAYHGVVKGKLVTIAASTDMPALVGSITAAYFNVYCFFIDEAEALTVAMGTEGATRVAVKFPAFPENKALVGFIIVTYASAFVGNTTALDTATTQYVSPVGPFDPTVLI